jgi:PD-(D/E)XK nuclease superfamily
MIVDATITVDMTSPAPEVSPQAPTPAPGAGLLTASSSKAYRTCPRLYSLTYERGYRPVRAADALAFGSLIHRALEAWWLAARDYEGDPLRLARMVDAALDVAEREPDPFDRARATAAIWGYHTRWAAMAFQGVAIRVVGVEVEFRGPLLNPETGAASKTWERGGKIDAVIEVAGVCYVVEHKTTSEDVSAGSDYWQRLHLDAQVSGYLSGARLLGFEPAGVLYDVIKKPALQPYKATPPERRRYTKAGVLDARQREADEEPRAFFERLTMAIADDLDGHFSRGTIVRIGDEEAEAARDLWQTGLQIRDSRRLDVWPRNPDACFRFGRRCPFFEVCAGLAGLDDPSRFRRAERPHEELSPPPPALVPAP